MKASPHGGPEQGSRFGLGRLLLFLTLSLAWFLALRPAVDPDYGWHIENGRRVLDGSAFAGRDMYSWTASNEWIVHEWLIEAAMSIVHDSLGATTNSILAALVSTVAFFIVAMRLRGRGFDWLTTNVAVALGFLCTMMSTGVRPQMLELVYLAAVLLLIDRHRALSRRDGYLIAVIVTGMVLWVNTHGSFPLLIAILGACTVGAVLDRDGIWRVYAIAAVSATVAALVNPWGFDIYSFATQSITSQPTLQSIDEWKRPRLVSGSLLPFNIAVILAGIAAVASLARRSHGAASRIATLPTQADVLIFLGMLFLGITSGRHVMLMGVGSAPLIAWSIASVVKQWKKSLAEKNQSVAANSHPGKDIINVVAAALVSIAIAMTGWEVVKPVAQERALGARYPVGMINELRALSVSPGKMFNEYSWGGFLIANSVTPVFIDGRSEVYGDAQLVRYGRIVRLSPRWRETMDSLGVNVAVIRRDAPLAKSLEQAGWKRVASDSIGVALVR